MSDSNDKPTVAIRSEDLVSCPKLKMMNKQDRLDFIDWMFDVMPTIKAKSMRSMANQVSALYKEEHPFKLNQVWVYSLLRAGIYKLSNGNYGFEKDVGHTTVEEVCANPTLLKLTGL